VCLGPAGNELINRGWFNQGFQETLGVAGLAAKLLELDVEQTRMALGHAASAMAGMMKNRGSDTKGFTAGSAAMHGVIAAELAAMGFTANADIIDGDLGVARLLGLEQGDPELVLDGLGSWDMATRGATIRLHACCGAAHWSMDALQKIVQRRPTAPGEIESIEVTINDFLTDMVPYHAPQTGLEAKYSLEYAMAAVALDGRAGMYQYSDDAVRRPEAQELMRRVVTVPASGGPLGSRVVMKLTNGEVVEESVDRSHGTPADPLTRDERLGKFHECASALASESQRNEVIGICERLDELESVRELTNAIGSRR
jgi:2-methylcitrate dehydratase PrpD